MKGYSLLLEIGQLDEFPAAVRPTESQSDRSRFTPGIGHRVEATTGISLQNAGEIGDMSRCLFAF